MDSSKRNVIGMISTVYRKTQIYLNQGTKDLGIHGGQAAFLMVACEYGPIPQREFCRILDIDKSTTAKVLYKLEQEGYILRKADGRDGRIINIYPTEKALKIYPVLGENGKLCVQKITVGFSEVEKNIFGEILKKVCGNISGGKDL